MKKYFFLLALILFSSMYFYSQAQTFQRTGVIPAPQIGGFGNIVAGVDLDKDGKPEIYACNNNTLDRGPEELIPRIWKFEWNGTTWDSVWGAVMEDIPLQNTWPALATGDLDGDGNAEIIWGPVNNLDANTNPNPARIIVFEVVPGTENLGVSDGFGGWIPNCKTSIITTAMTELRPNKFVIVDIDGDGKQEVVYNDRNGSANQHYGIMSVSDVPANGAAVTWTQKATGLGDAVLAGTGAKNDFAVLNGIIYLLNSDGKIFPIKKTGSTWASLPAQTGMGGATYSWKGALTVDIDGNGTKEIVVGQRTVTGGDTAVVYLLKQQGDTLVSSKIANFRSLGGYRLNGSDAGDIDGDGKLDMVWGTRYDANQNPNNAVYRLAYKGGDITKDTSYTKSMIDALFFATGSDLDAISIGNCDGDATKEVVYTSGYPRGDDDSAMAIVVLDMHKTPLEVKSNTRLVPDNYYMSQNYPNPFNPSTTIEFGLPKESSVQLAIYNIAGQKVQSLISGEIFKAGTHKVKFNAYGLASGTYLIELKANDFSFTRKMVFLK